MVILPTKPQKTASDKRYWWSKPTYPIQNKAVRFFGVVHSNIVTLQWLWPVYGPICT